MLPREELGVLELPSKAIHLFQGTSYIRPSFNTYRPYQGPNSHVTLARQHFSTGQRKDFCFLWGAVTLFGAQSSLLVVLAQEAIYGARIKWVNCERDKLFTRCALWIPRKGLFPHSLDKKTKVKSRIVSFSNLHSPSEVRAEAALSSNMMTWPPHNSLTSPC